MDLVTQGAAHAGFQLAQILFTLLLKNGAISLKDAERMLEDAARASDGGGPANKACAQFLRQVLPKPQ